jgi:hypothetical protein
VITVSRISVKKINFNKTKTNLLQMRVFQIRNQTPAFESPQDILKVGNVQVQARKGLLSDTIEIPALPWNW